MAQQTTKRSLISLLDIVLDWKTRQFTWRDRYCQTAGWRSRSFLSVECSRLFSALRGDRNIQPDRHWRQVVLLQKSIHWQDFLLIELAPLRQPLGQILTVLIDTCLQQRRRPRVPTLDHESEARQFAVQR